MSRKTEPKTPNSENQNRFRCTQASPLVTHLPRLIESRGLVTTHGNFSQQVHRQREDIRKNANESFLFKFGKFTAIYAPALKETPYSPTDSQSKIRSKIVSLRACSPPGRILTANVEHNLYQACIGNKNMPTAAPCVAYNLNGSRVIPKTFDFLRCIFHICDTRACRPISRHLKNRGTFDTDRTHKNL